MLNLNNNSLSRTKGFGILFISSKTSTVNGIKGFQLVIIIISYFNKSQLLK